MKKNLIKGFIITSFVLVGAFTLSLTSVNASSVYDQLSSDVDTEVVTETTTLTLEQMLVYAIQDEYLAQAEYNAIIAAYGEVRPFTNIVEAEQTHIDLLLTLFVAYGIEVPANTASDYVVLPDSLTSAIATGVDAETANIAMYQAFLAQGDLPDDVVSAFTYLISASETHLQAFSRDRYSCLGTDMMNQFKNAIGNRNQKGSGTANQYKGSNGSGSGNAYKGSNGTGSSNQFSGSLSNDGICPNL